MFLLGSQLRSDKCYNFLVIDCFLCYSCPWDAHVLCYLFRPVECECRPSVLACLGEKAWRAFEWLHHSYWALCHPSCNVFKTRRCVANTGNRAHCRLSRTPGMCWLKPLTCWPRGWQERWAAQTDWKTLPYPIRVNSWVLEREHGMALCYWEAKRLPGAPPSRGDNHVQNLCAPLVILQTDGWKTSRFLNLSSCDSAFQVK